MPSFIAYICGKYTELRNSYERDWGDMRIFVANYSPRTTCMDLEQKREAFFKKLRVQLANDTSWPSDYLFKFIVPTDVQKIGFVEKVFDNLGAVITTTPSSKGNYTSISIQVKMSDPDAVIAKYKEVAVVEGIISL